MKRESTVIITWFGAGSPEYQLSMFKDVIDDEVFKALSYTEEEDANDCRISNGEDEKVLHRRSNINEIISAGGKNFPPKHSTT